MGAPPPPLLSRLEAFQRAPALPVPRQRSTDAHEPCGMGSGRAAASVRRRGRLLWVTAAEPTQRRRRRRLNHARRRVCARQRLHYIGMDIRRPESCAARPRGAHRPLWSHVAALSLARSVAHTAPSPLSRLAACLRAPSPAVPRQGHMLFTCCAAWRLAVEHTRRITRYTSACNIAPGTTIAPYSIVALEPTRGKYTYFFVKKLTRSRTRHR